MSLDENARATFFALADALIPDSEGMPRASAAGDISFWVDRTLALRHDLVEPTALGLLLAEGKAPRQALDELSASQPASYEAIGYVAAAAYLMSEDVRRRLGYPGQERREFDPDATPEYVENGLLQAVIDRGPIYRRTPQ
jgi:hypothetical protein